MSQPPRLPPLGLPPSLPPGNRQPPTRPLQPPTSVLQQTNAISPPSQPQGMPRPMLMPMQPGRPVALPPGLLPGMQPIAPYRLAAPRPMLHGLPPNVALHSQTQRSGHAPGMVPQPPKMIPTARTGLAPVMVTSAAPVVVSRAAAPVVLSVQPLSSKQVETRPVLKMDSVKATIPGAAIPTTVIGATSAMLASAAAEVRAQQEIPDIPEQRVFIGGLHERLDDEFFKKVLDRVGTLLAWERFTNPITKKASSFGFAHFSSRDITITATKVLNMLKFSTTIMTDPVSTEPCPEEPSKKVSKIVMTLEVRQERRMLTQLSSKDEARVVELRQKLMKDIPKLEEAFRAEKGGAKPDSGAVIAEPTSRRGRHDHLQSSPSGRHLREILEAEERVPEALIDEVAVIEPQPLGMPDEIYEDLINFRKVQAKDDIVSTRRLRRLVVEAVQRQRKEEERLRARSLAASLQQNTAHVQPSRNGVSKEHFPTETNQTNPEARADESVSVAKLGDVSFPLSLAVSEKPTRKKAGGGGGMFSEFSGAENVKTKRKLVPIQYSKEEEEALAGFTDSDAMKQKVNAVIVKVLGEGDDSFADFIIKKLQSKITRQQLIDEVKDILEEEAVEFANELQAFLQ